MLITLLVSAAIIGFILAVAKILDVPLQRLRVDHADHVEEAGHDRTRVIVQDDPTEPASSEAPEVAGPIYQEPEEPEERRSRLGAWSRLLVLVLAVATSVALVIVVLIEWVGGVIEKALS